MMRFSLISVFVVGVGSLLCSCQPRTGDVQNALKQLRDTSISDSDACRHVFALCQWLGRPSNQLAAYGLDEKSVADVVLPYLQRTEPAVRGDVFGVFEMIGDDRVRPFLRAELLGSSGRCDYRLVGALRRNGGEEDLAAILERIRTRPDSNAELVYTLYSIGHRHTLAGIQALNEVSTFQTISPSERSDAIRLRNLLQNELTDLIRAGVITTNSQSGAGLRP